MQKIYNTAIIGGGAAGLMTAVELTRGNSALSGDEVLILERMDRVGKKLIATGNGQGNLMNRNFGAQFYHGDKDFIDAFIANTINIDLQNYLSELGIPLCTLKDGKMYPLSRQASAVLDIIRAYLDSKGCVTQTNSLVTEITKKGEYYTIKSSSGIYVAKSVVLAVGGAAQKQFGTDGSSYCLAQNFGHKKSELYPSLVQLKTQTDPIRGLKGLKEVATVSAVVGGKTLTSSTGDLLFTDYGVSGSAVFQVSAYLSGKENEYLNIEFLPEMSQKEVTVLLKNRLSCGYIAKADILVGILNKRIGQAVLKTVKEITAESVAHALKNFKLKVTGNVGFNYAQVTKGGIKTNDIDKNTFESKLAKGVYIVGEMLDVDGDCGGYNITFAFSSAIAAARAIKGA